MFDRSIDLWEPNFMILLTNIFGFSDRSVFGCLTNHNGKRERERVRKKASLLTLEKKEQIRKTIDDCWFQCSGYCFFCKLLGRWAGYSSLMGRRIYPMGCCRKHIRSDRDTHTVRDSGCGSHYVVVLPKMRSSRRSLQVPMTTTTASTTS